MTGRTTRPRDGQRTTSELEETVALLKRRGTRKVRDGMARYAIPSDNAFGVSVGTLKEMSTKLGRNHGLAEGLWDSGWYEARMLAAFVGEPDRVTPAQMDRWCSEFDNWAITDHVCFHLFDRTPHAWSKVSQWSGRSDEYGKRAAFALLWGLTVHDKTADDAAFMEGLRHIEAAADDDRNFVKKAVNMALRAVGKRNARLNAAAVVVAQRLAESRHAAARWTGKDALRELTSARVTGRFARSAKRGTTRKPK